MLLYLPTLYRNKRYYLINLKVQNIYRIISNECVFKSKNSHRNQNNEIYILSIRHSCLRCVFWLRVNCVPNGVANHHSGKSYFHVQFVILHTVYTHTLFADRNEIKIIQIIMEEWVPVVAMLLVLKINYFIKIISMVSLNKHVLLLL